MKYHRWNEVKSNFPTKTPFTLPRISLKQLLGDFEKEDTKEHNNLEGNYGFNYITLLV